MKIHYLPLEPLEERYTEQMFWWVVDALGPGGLRTYKPNMALEPSGAGDFLNWRQRAKWSLYQMDQILNAYDDIKNGDVVFFADIWHPGLEALHYVRELEATKRFKMYAINYAGPFDEFDRLSHNVGFEEQEIAWYQMLDGVFLGSANHKQQIIAGLNKHGILEDDIHAKLHVTGLVWEPDKIAVPCRSHSEPQRPVVLWPHRWCSEKGCGMLVDVARATADLGRPDIRFVVSTSRKGEKVVLVDANVHFICHSKPEYYQMLRDSRLMLSTAHQETYGYTVQEAAVMQTPVLAPRRAAYPEYVHPDALYDAEASASDIAKIVIAHIEGVKVIPLTEPRYAATGIDVMRAIMEGEA